MNSKQVRLMSRVGMAIALGEDVDGDPVDRVISRVALFNSKGELCMGKRNDNGAYTDVGGHVDEGEDPLEGARRECHEETGIELEPDDLTHLASETVTKEDGERLDVHVYRADVDGETPTTKEDPDGEVQRWEWVDVSDGLPDHIADNLHVPVGDNVTLRALELEPANATTEAAEPGKPTPVAPKPAAAPQKATPVASKPAPAPAAPAAGKDRASALKAANKGADKVFKAMDDLAQLCREEGLGDVAKLVSGLEDGYWDFKRSLAKIRESVEGRGVALTESNGPTPADEMLIKKAMDLIKHNVAVVHGGRLSRTTPICVFPNRGADNPNTRPMDDLGRGATGVGASATLEVGDANAAYSALKKKLDPLVKAAKGQVWYDPEYDDHKGDFVGITVWFQRAN